MSTPGTTSGTTARTTPALLIAGATALALALATLLSTGGRAIAEESRHDGRMHDGTMQAGAMQDRLHGRGEADPQMRTEHVRELAERFGVDSDALADAMAALRSDLEAQRAQMREDLQGLDRDARIAAMTDRSEARKGLMADVLAELGVDPALIAEHHAEMDHGDRADHAQRQQRGGDRMAGPHARR